MDKVGRILVGDIDFLLVFTFSNGQVIMPVKKDNQRKKVEIFNLNSYQKNSD